MIALFGPAGSGKSLQGQALAEKYGWRWLSVGQLLRDQHNPEIDEKLKGGELFDDSFVTELMHQAMVEADKAGEKVILAGYPRDEWQAKWIAEKGDAAKIELAIVLEVPAEELWKRIEGRGRSDDTEVVVKRRWEIFEQNIYSILPVLRDAGVRVERLNGVGEIDEVTKRIEALLLDSGLVEEVVWDDDEWDDEKSYGE